MNSRFAFLLTALEVICLILVVFGLSQAFDAVGVLQWALFNNWNAIWIFLATVFLIGVAVAVFWDKKDPLRSGTAHQTAQSIIALYVAYMICTYAFAKLLKTQFQPPAYVLETPIGELNGFWLTWTYFGYSETFANILGLTQIAGSILLLFRKTRLLGAFVLIPVMVNICLIDHFYSISPLAYFNALHYTFILFFFVAIDTPKLTELFFSERGTLTFGNWKFWLLNVSRVAVVFFAFYKIYSFRNEYEPKSDLNGVWRVDKMSVAGKPDSTTEKWSKVYLEWRYGGLLKSDPNVFGGKDRYLTYKIDREKHQLKFNIQPNAVYSTTDSLLVNYKFVTDSQLTLNGLLNGDSIKMELTKLK